LNENNNFPFRYRINPRF